MYITCIFENEDSTLCETKKSKSGEFWWNSVEIRQKAFHSFHSFSQVQNAFPSWGNLIPLISPVATLKTGENSSEKKGKRSHRET